jgi:hypothetical protein
MVLALHNCTVCCGCYKAHQLCAPAEKSVINLILLLISVSIRNMILLVISVSDWPVIMVGPSGLLLLVPHLFAVPV